jgi:hypothetical protein
LGTSLYPISISGWTQKKNNTPQTNKQTKTLVVRNAKSLKILVNYLSLSLSLSLWTKKNYSQKTLGCQNAKMFEGFGNSVAKKFEDLDLV